MDPKDLAVFRISHDPLGQIAADAKKSTFVSQDQLDLLSRMTLTIYTIGVSSASEGSSRADMRTRFASVLFPRVVRGGCSGRVKGTDPQPVAAWARNMLVVFFFAAAVVPGTYPQSVSNSDPTYSTLRNITLGSEAVSVANFDLKRDAGKFHLN